MTSQANEYIKQAIRSLTYAKLECELGTPADISATSIINNALPSLMGLIMPTPVVQPTSVPSTDVVHAAPNASY